MLRSKAFKMLSTHRNTAGRALHRCHTRRVLYVYVWNRKLYKMVEFHWKHGLSCDKYGNRLL